MRVVHLINGLPAIGGAERLVLDLARHALAKPTSVITWRSADTGLLRDDRDGDLDVIPLRPFTLAALSRARSALRAADVVHVHLFPSQYLGALLTKPTVFTEHNTWNRRRDLPWMRPFDRASYHRYDAVAVISRPTGEALTRWLGRPHAKMAVIPNGIRLDRFTLVPRKPPAPDAPVNIGMAARFSPEKDQPTLVRALALLPDRYRLVLAGQGPLEADLKSLAAEHGLAERVVFAGVARDMPAFFENLDVYVQSSNADGFSLVSAEAMASGLPTLASDIDGLRDTVGRPEQLADPADPAALAALILRTVEVSDAYRAAADHGVIQAQRYDIAVTAQAYQALYAEVAR